MGEATKQEDAKAETQPEERKEEKAEEKAEEKKEEANPPPPPPIILFIDMHCVGCAKKIERSIMKFRGVEAVEIDMIQNQVTIKGIVDPQALCLRIQKKTKREARVLSPLPTAEGDSTKPEVVASQVSGLTTIELFVNMHCEACAQQLKRKILKMRGVQTAETNLSSGTVTVIGTMDANKFAEDVYRRTKKQAKIVPQPTNEKEEEKKADEGAKEGEKVAEEAAKPEEEKTEDSNTEKKEDEKGPKENKGDEKKAEKEATEGDEEQKKEGEENVNNEEMAKKMMHWHPVYVIESVPAPQLFSDENPNACCIS